MPEDIHINPQPPLPPITRELLELPSFIEVEIKVTAVNRFNDPIKSEWHHMTGSRDAIVEFLLVNYKQFPEFASRAKRMLDALPKSPHA